MRPLTSWSFTTAQACSLPMPHYQPWAVKLTVPVAGGGSLVVMFTGWRWLYGAGVWAASFHLAPTQMVLLLLFAAAGRANVSVISDGQVFSQEVGVGDFFVLPKGAPRPRSMPLSLSGSLACRHPDGVPSRLPSYTPLPLLPLLASPGFFPSSLPPRPGELFSIANGGCSDSSVVVFWDDKDPGRSFPLADLHLLPRDELLGAWGVDGTTEVAAAGPGFAPFNEPACSALCKRSS